MTFDKGDHISNEKKRIVFTQNKMSFRAWRTLQSWIQELCHMELFATVGNGRKLQDIT